MQEKEKNFQSLQKLATCTKPFIKKADSSYCSFDEVAYLFKAPLRHVMLVFAKNRCLNGFLQRYSYCRCVQLVAAFLSTENVSHARPIQPNTFTIFIE